MPRINKIDMGENPSMNWQAPPVGDPRYNPIQSICWWNNGSTNYNGIPQGNDVCINHWGSNTIIGPDGGGNGYDFDPAATYHVWVHGGRPFGAQYGTCPHRSPESTFQVFGPQCYPTATPTDLNLNAAADVLTWVSAPNSYYFLRINDLTNGTSYDYLGNGGCRNFQGTNNPVHAGGFTSGDVCYDRYSGTSLTFYDFSPARSYEIWIHGGAPNTGSCPTITNPPYAETFSGSFPNVTIAGTLRQQTGGQTRAATTGNAFRLNLVAASGLNLSPAGCGTVATCAGVPSQTAAIGYSCSITFNIGCYLNPSNASIQAQILDLNGNSAAAFFSSTTAQTTPNSFTLSETNTNVSNADITFAYTGGAWMKMRNTSFLARTNSPLTNPQPPIIASFDAQDPGGRQFIEGEAGIVSNINPAPYGRASQRGWTITNYTPAYTGASSTTLVDYATLLTASRPVVTRTITSGALTITRGELTVVDAGSTTQTLSNLTINGSSGIAVLIIRNGTQLGTLDINTTSLNPTNIPLVVIAETIRFLPDGNVVAGGIFVANTIETDSAPSGGTLKITGNLIALKTFHQRRSRADGDHARPTLFIDVSIPMYLDALGTLGVRTQTWEQVE
jgi:hypothetical protein